MQSHNRFDCFLTNYIGIFWRVFCSDGFAHTYIYYDHFAMHPDIHAVALFELPLATSFDKWNWPPKNRALLLVLLNWNRAMYV